jgi:hypothetical protein
VESRALQPSARGYAPGAGTPVLLPLSLHASLVEQVSPGTGSQPPPPRPALPPAHSAVMHRGGFITHRPWLGSAGSPRWGALPDMPGGGGTETRGQVILHLLLCF